MPLPSATNLAADANNIYVYAPYDPVLLAICKDLPGRVWDKEERRWEIPNSPRNLIRVVGDFPGATHSKFFKRCMERVFTMPPSEIPPDKRYKSDGTLYVPPPSVLDQNTLNWQYNDRDGYKWEILAAGHPAREFFCTSCARNDDGKNLAEIFCADLNAQICLPCFESYVRTLDKPGPSEAQKANARKAAASKLTDDQRAFIKTILGERRPLIPHQQERKGPRNAKSQYR